MNEYHLLAVVSRNFKIKRDEDSPWHRPEFRKYFDQITNGSIVIMGRNTFESLPSDCRPFAGRLNVVLTHEPGKYRALESETLKFMDLYFFDNKILPTMELVPVWVIGGGQVFDALHRRCKYMDLLHLDKTAPANELTFANIPPSFELTDYSEARWSDDEQCNYRILNYTMNPRSHCIDHEKQYFATLRHILETGNDRRDRTGVGTIGVFGGQHRYDVSKYLPILTSKFVPIKVIIKELLWFLKGHTDAKILQAQNVHIWDGNSSAAFLESRGLPYEEGDIGPGYGFQWRHFGGTYGGCRADHTGEGVDQIQYILDLLKNDPFSRRILLSAWNPAALSQMALPPCHVMFQLYVEEDADGVRYLSGHLYQRSQDFFLAANYNLVSYTVLLYILAKKVGYKPKEMIVSWGDVHVYKNHLEQCAVQLTRHPLPQPILTVSDDIISKSIEEVHVDDFELIGYHYAPAIKADMAV